MEMRKISAALASQGREEANWEKLPSRNLLKAFHEVQIGQHAMVSVNAGFGVGRQQDGPNVFYAGGIGRHELAPKCALAGCKVQLKDASRQLAGLINVDGFP